MQQELHGRALKKELLRLGQFLPSPPTDPTQHSASDSGHQHGTAIRLCPARRYERGPRGGGAPVQVLAVAGQGQRVGRVGRRLGVGSQALARQVRDQQVHGAVAGQPARVGQAQQPLLGGTQTVGDVGVGG